jgi:dihydroorotate dehydrogenase
MTLIHNLGLNAMKCLDPERAHRAAITALKMGLGPVNRRHYSSLQTEIAGLKLSNPVGLAAGFDKDAEVSDAMLTAGFGFVEAGSVTPRPQSGNAKPRLFRLSQDQAVINRMGFNNQGLGAFAARLKARAGKPGIVGANLGANKDSSDKTSDYVLGLKKLWGLCDFFTVNISSPNTPGLRDLQSGDALSELLAQVQETRSELMGDGASPPVFLKVAPDLDFVQIDRITEQARTYGMSGIIVSNTTLARPESLRSRHKSESGGLSGAPLMGPSTQILKEFYAASEGRIPLIGVGGIASGKDAYQKIRAGAQVVQLYSALVFKGPGLASEICKDLVGLLKADGFANVSEAVGVDHKD